MRLSRVDDRPPITVAPGPNDAAHTPPHSRRWVWFAGLVVMAILGYAGYRKLPALANVGAPAAKSAASRDIPVITSVARRGDLPIYFDGLGTVTAFNTVTVRTRVDGPVVKVAFVEGQMVKAGDLLVQIDERPFQADLDSKLASEGQAAAQVDLAKITYNRLKALMPEHSASPIEFQTAEATLKQADAALAAAKANVESARLNVEWCRITAPISGRIGLRMVDLGNLVRSGEATGLAIITQLQPIAVKFSLPQADLPYVLAAQGGDKPLPALAYNTDMKTLLATGTLAAIDNQIDSNTGTARFKAVFENTDLSLFPNQFVNVRLLVDTKKDVVLVPTAAVQRSPQSVFVYVIKADHTVDLRPIVPGPTEAGLTLIESGLQPGEIVVTDGVDKLQPGSRVKDRGRTASQPSGSV